MELKAPGSMDDSTPLWILLGKGSWEGGRVKGGREEGLREEGRKGGGDNESHRPSLSAAR